MSLLFKEAFKKGFKYCSSLGVLVLVYIAIAFSCLGTLSIASS